MNVNELWKRFGESSETSDLQDLRKDLILELGAGGIAVGWIVAAAAFGFGGIPATLWVAVVLMGASLGAIWLRQKNFPAALYCLVGGLLVATACFKLIVPEGLGQFFYPLAVVISGLLVSNLSVFLVAGVTSAVCLGAAQLSGYAWSDPREVLLPVALIFLTAFAAWLSSRQIHSALGWMRSSYAQARQWLEELRDERMAQQRTIKILEEAYIRIEKLNYQLMEARKAAEEARQLKAEFAANISHELRTPLNVIIGFSETMANAPETYSGATWTPMLRGDVEEIYRSSRHLLSLIDDILDLSALEVHRLGLNLQEADITEVAEEAAAVVRGLYQAKHLYLKIEAQADLPHILIDVTRIRQVLINLLSNASRFTTTGGVTILITLEGDSVRAAVKDTGIGIAARDMHKVFAEFGQVDGSIRRLHEGSGLGVPLSKRLVEMHGGTMWLESTPGSGTTVYFTLPWSYAPLTAEQLARGQVTDVLPAPRTAYRKSLLVAEPDPLLVRTMRRQLSAYDVIEVRDGLDLPGLIQKHHPLALVLDEPGLLNCASQEEWLSLLPAGLPVIRASFQGNLRVAKELGILDYLIKPTSREQLLDSLSSVGTGVRQVLLVDDDPQLVELFTRMLDSTGGAYELVKAYSGEDALQILNSQDVDLVLLDVVLPGMSGMDVLRAMKKDERLANLPVIMISGQNPEGLISANPLSISLQRAECATLIQTLNYLRLMLDALPAVVPAPAVIAGVPPAS